MGSGVAGAIHNAAGPKLKKYCKPFIPLKLRSALITPGLQFSMSWNIHVPAAHQINNTETESYLAGLLERDFIVTVEELKGESFVSASENDGAYAVVASFCPNLQEKEPTPLGLKILVDCSGSMQGDSIEQAQEAMHQLILRLTEQDMVSYSNFGSKVIHTSNQLEKCTPRYIKNVMAKAVHDTAADLGGTELNQPLTSTFKISFTKAYT